MLTDVARDQAGSGPVIQISREETGPRRVFADAHDLDGLGLMALQPGLSEDRTMSADHSHTGHDHGGHDH